jgi:hypothetical protein
MQFDVRLPGLHPEEAVQQLRIRPKMTSSRGPLARVGAILRQVIVYTKEPSRSSCLACIYSFSSGSVPEDGDQVVCLHVNAKQSIQQDLNTAGRS